MLVMQIVSIVCVQWREVSLSHLQPFIWVLVRTLWTLRGIRAWTLPDCLLSVSQMEECIFWSWKNCLWLRWPVCLPLPLQLAVSFCAVCFFAFSVRWNSETGCDHISIFAYFVIKCLLFKNLHSNGLINAHFICWWFWTSFLSPVSHYLRHILFSVYDMFFDGCAVKRLWILVSIICVKLWQEPDGAIFWPSMLFYVVFGDFPFCL